jgi:hypothetical protein
MSPHRASIEERINWSTGFTRPADKVVLGALATWADYESGRNARPGMPELVARADLPKRTVERSLRRLIDERWIAVTRRRHLGYTTYAINLAKLATSATRARLVDRPLSANVADNADDPLSANVAGLSANVAELSANVADVPVISTRDQYPSAPARVAPAPIAPTENTTADGGAVFARGDYGLAATEGAHLAARGGDVCANGDDRAPRDRDRPDARPDEPLRPDRALASDAGISVRDGDDSPRDRGADARPQQQAFGPLALDDAIGGAAEQRRAALVTLGDVWRAALRPRRAGGRSS